MEEEEEEAEEAEEAEVGSSGKVSLSEKVVLVLVAIDAAAVKKGSGFLPSRRLLGRVVVGCAIKTCAIKTCAIKAGTIKAGCRQGEFGNFPSTQVWVRVLEAGQR